MMSRIPRRSPICRPRAWPAGAKPVTRTMQYDGLYRLKQIDYAHNADEHVPAFGPEVGVAVAERRGAS